MPGFLSELSPEKEKKQFGFTVYLAEDGSPMALQSCYALDGNGNLFFEVEGEHREYVSRTGHLIIFFNDCSWMRY